MDFTDVILIGKITIAAGIMAFIQITLLTLMFTVSMKPFGLMSDYAYALTPILMLPLMFSLRSILQGQNGAASQWALVLSVIGAVIASVSQVIFIVNVIDLKQSMVGNGLGVGMMGIAILIYSLLGRANVDISTAFAWFGIILGAGMALGLVSGTVFLDQTYGMATRSFDMRDLNPFMYLFLLAVPVTQLGLPVWLLMLGRMLLLGKLDIPA
jgi:hypothetical protein